MKIYFYLFLLISCTGIVKSQNMRKLDDSKNYLLESYLKINWGNSLQTVIIDPNENKGNDIYASNIDIYKDVSFKLGYNEDVYIFHNFEIINASPQKVTKFILEKKESYQLARCIDFLMTPNNIIYLLLQNDHDNFLLKFNAKGNLEWQKKGNFNHDSLDFENLVGKFENLSIDNHNKIFINSFIEGNKIGEINPLNGEITPFKNIIAGTRIALANKYGSVLNEDVMNLKNDSSKLNLTSQIVRSNIHFLFGTDHQQNCFTYNRNMIQFSFEGDLLKNIPIGNILILNDNQIVNSYIQNDSLYLHSFHQKKAIRQKEIIPLPDCLDNVIDRIQLLKINNKNEFLMISENTLTYDFNIFLITKNGHCKEIAVPSDLYKEAFFTQHYKSWKVDNSGNIYIPILTPNALEIVKLSL